jgi:uncharacterized membrane protein
MSGYRYLFYGLVAFSVGQVVYYYPQLPEVMASHFDGSGSANGWSSREVFIGIYLAMVVLVIGIFRLLPGWSLTHSRFSLKIPHREYWLAPARREQTHAFFRNHMAVMGVAHLLLAIITIELAIRANLGQHTRLHDGIYWALSLYFIFLGGWLIHFFMHFRKQ